MFSTLKSRKPMKRGGRLRRFTPLRSISKKRAKQSRSYYKQRKLFLLAHPLCEYWLREHGFTDVGGHVFQDEAGIRYSLSTMLRLHHPPGSVVVHHTNKRRGEMLLDESFWMAVSFEGHNWIETHKDLARARGYLRDF